MTSIVSARILDFCDQKSNIRASLVFLLLLLTSLFTMLEWEKHKNWERKEENMLLIWKGINLQSCAVCRCVGVSAVCSDNLQHEENLRTCGELHVVSCCCSAVLLGSLTKSTRKTTATLGWNTFPRRRCRSCLMGVVCGSMHKTFCSFNLTTMFCVWYSLKIILHALTCSSGFDLIIAVMFP